MKTQSSWHAWVEEGTATLYERLAAAIESDIRNGLLPPGTRLPAHRQLAQQLQIAVGTVTRAYLHLEQQGLVQGQHGRGTFVATSDQPGAPALSGRSSASGGAVELLDLSLNVPPPLIAAEKLATTLAQLSDAFLAADFSNYADASGVPRHRQVLAGWLSGQGVQADVERVLITHGAQHALAVAFAVTAPTRGTVYTEPHTYGGALSAARQALRQLVAVPVDEEGMIPEALAEDLQGANPEEPAIVYLTPTLHNPYGISMPQHQRREIIAVCRHHDATIIEDDVYSTFRTPHTTPLVALAPERTWYINGFSKCMGPGLRVGVLIAPAQQLQRAATILQATALAVSPIMAELATRWIQDGTARDVATALRAESQERLALADTILGDYLARRPAGGFHLWLPLPRQRAEEVAHHVARAGVLVTPPASVLTDPAGQSAGLRLCIGRPTLHELDRGLRKLRRILAGPGQLAPPS